MPRNRPKPEPAVSHETVAGWHARRGALLAKLHAQPQSQWAWLWRVHVDIADYLIHRYGGQGGGGAGGTSPIEMSLGSAAPGAAAAGTVDDEVSAPRLPRLHGSARVAKAASLEGPDAERMRASLRDRLSSLHATNDARRASQPPILPTPPPPPYRPLFSTLFLPPQAPPDARQLIRRTTFPDDGWRPMDDGADVDPLDDTSLALFRQAIANDQGWDLETAEALTEDEVLRLLLGEEGDIEAGDIEPR